MGLNKENRKVIRSSKSDEEQRYRGFAHMSEKQQAIMAERTSQGD
jgi:hypothetical protein